MNTGVRIEMRTNFRAFIWTFTNGAIDMTHDRNDRLSGYKDVPDHPLDGPFPTD